MVNRIIDGLCETLNGEWPDTDIFTEEITQGLETPCFSIVPLNPSVSHTRGLRYLRKTPFCIHYFPESKEPRKECYDVAERLMDLLELIPVTDVPDGDASPTRGTGMRYEIIDGVLSFFVTYDFYARRLPEELPKMEDLKYSPGVNKEV